MPGCVQYVSMEWEVALGTGSGTSVAYTFSIPNDPALMGGALFNQFTHVDPSANPLGFVNSNAGRLLLGLH